MQTEDLEVLSKSLNELESVSDRIQLLIEAPYTQDFKLKYPQIFEWILTFTESQKYYFLLVLAIGQGEAIFHGMNLSKPAGVENLLKVLQEMEHFYSTIGGVVGYQLSVLKLLKGKRLKFSMPENTRYLEPTGIDLQKETPEVKRYVRFGIENLDKLAEIYPVGGAGDRLSLLCERQQEPLPAAQLLFLGRTLIEGLIRDVQAREYLYFKLNKKQITLPIALMTSHEKRNHHRVQQIFEAHQWFHRGKENFRLFVQPMVPMVADTGRWVVSKPLHLRLKPGGHGAIWKLALDNGIFEWFTERGAEKGIVRQINNPAAGIDHGLLSFTGVGFHHDKQFGFASCPRLPESAEGTDILLEQKTDKGYSYTLTNIEYTEFSQRGIEDKAVSETNPYSKYPANTNILFFDFNAIREAEKKCPIPGMLMNMKNKVEIDGREYHAGRLESTMQNIADVMTLETPQPLTDFRQMETYLTFNARRKTLSVAKNAYSAGKKIIGTPEGCFYELMQNMEELFRNYCNYQLPKFSDQQTYLKQGPSFLILYHPAIGPLYSIIGQKIRKGFIEEGSELQLEIAEVDIENLSLDGSMLVTADFPMGHFQEGVRRYSHTAGSCTLKNVTVKNRGIDRTHQQNIYWKNEIHRKEVLEIRIYGSGEFYAENVNFQGDFHLVVPDGYKMVAYEEGSAVKFTMEPLKQYWFWDYAFDEDDSIVLTKTASDNG